MQAAIREIIYWTVNKTTFLQIKNEDNAASVWRKITLIHADKGSLYEANLLVQLQDTCYNKKESMREHIGKMTELRERLAEMNALISDESFISYLWTSLSLAPSFQNLFFTSLSTTVRQTGKKLTPGDVIWHLTEEATSVKIEDSINKSNAMMMALRSKSGGKDKGKKEKSSKSNIICSNTVNCGWKGHTGDQCWEKGGGKEGQAPNLWKKKKGKKASANVAEEKTRREG